MRHLLDSKKDAPLLHDIELLNRILQRIMQAKISPQSLQAFQLLISDEHHDTKIAELLSGLSLQETQELVASCGLYAQVFNIAEDVHHARRRRAYEATGASASKGSIEELLQKIKTSHISTPLLQNVLDLAQ